MSIQPEQVNGNFSSLNEGRGFGPAIIGGALILAGGLVAGDELLTRRRPLCTTPYLEEIPPIDGRTTNVVFGYASGFNSHPLKPGNVYARTAREFATVLIEQDPETGYDAELSHATFAEKCMELEAEDVVLIGDSAGGLKQLSLANYLIENCGINATVTEVSTPNHKTHIQGLHRKSMLAFLAIVDRLGIRGGDGFRQFAEMLGSKIDNPHRSLKECRAHLQRKFASDATACTSPQVIKYARLLRGQSAARNLELLGPDRVRFASADDPKRDPVVRVHESHEFLEEHAGGPVRWLQHPTLNHANVCEDHTAARDIVRFSFKSAGIASIEERRSTISLHIPGSSVA